MVTFESCILGYIRDNFNILNNMKSDGIRNLVRFSVMTKYTRLDGVTVYKMNKLYRTESDIIHILLIEAIGCTLKGQRPPKIEDSMDLSNEAIESVYMTLYEMVKKELKEIV